MCLSLCIHVYEMLNCVHDKPACSDVVICVYACMRVCMYVCMYVCTHVCKRAGSAMNTVSYLSVHMYVCMYVLYASALVRL